MARMESKGGEPWNGGRDAAYIKPKLIPDDELRGRDNSGGIDFHPYTQEWDDGGIVTGMKPHLSAEDGMTDPDDDQDALIRERDDGEDGTRGKRELHGQVDGKRKGKKKED